jgi:hypothetical protein
MTIEVLKRKLTTILSFDLLHRERENGYENHRQLIAHHR